MTTHEQETIMKLMKTLLGIRTVESKNGITIPHRQYDKARKALLALEGKKNLESKNGNS